MTTTPSWNPQQVLEQLLVSRQELLKLMDYLMAGLESENVHALLAPAFARLYRRMVAILEEEKSFLEKMNLPDGAEREKVHNQLAKRVVAIYHAFKSAQDIEGQKKLAEDVIEVINGFTVQNYLLWDQITRDIKQTATAREATELAKAEALFAKAGIPSPPRILLEISKEMKKSEPDIGKIGALVKEDPALSAKVIQLINSPLYGLRVKITSISHAVSMLGLKLFQRAVLASALRSTLLAGGKDKKFEMFWQHALITARAAEFISLWLKEYEAPADLAYMVGLFHDCAVPSLMNKFPKYGDLFSEGAVPTGGNIRELENTGFDTNHCVVGQLIAKSWGLDSTVQDIIRYHHHEILPPSVTGNEVTRKLWHILKITEIITSHLIFKAGGQVIELSRAAAEFPLDHVEDAMLDELGIGRESLQYLIEDVEELAALGDIA